MHEEALCEGLVQALEEQAATQGFSRVHAVRLEVCTLAAVECQAIRFNFDIVTRGTLAENVHLDIVETEGSAWCMPCGTTAGIRGFGNPSRDCGSHQLQILGSKQIRIRQLEVT